MDKIELEEFSVVDNLENYSDSLLFEDHMIAELIKGNYAIEIIVTGEKRIFYKDQLYENANNYPKELIDLIKSANLYKQEDVEISSNNWFEINAYEIDDIGNYECIYYEVFEEELDKITKEQLKDLMNNRLNEIIEQCNRKEEKEYE
ncbi:MAG: hypothetical protein Q4G09_00265 [Clostridia bacterium]|nr:hypothetical protein [Clostridia bacterium]